MPERGSPWPEPFLMVIKIIQRLLTSTWHSLQGRIVKELEEDLRNPKGSQASCLDDYPRSYSVEDFLSVETYQLVGTTEAISNLIKCMASSVADPNPRGSELF